MPSAAVEVRKSFRSWTSIVVAAPVASTMIWPISWAIFSIGCASSRPPAPQSAVEAAPSIPLERICQDTFPLPPERTVGGLVRFLKRASPHLAIQAHPCHSGTEWPIGYAVGEEELAAHPGQSPVGYTVLRMEGDALLTFDNKDRDAPTVNLCQDLDIALDARHRVRAIALWESSDEAAFDPARVEDSRATLAWVELLSRAPSTCAMGQKEVAGFVGDAELAERLDCAGLPLVLTDRGKCDDPPVPAPATADADATYAAARGVHRYSQPGRDKVQFALGDLSLRLERPEQCFYEPPPARRDVCLAVYLEPSGERWYGRGDVTRTGQGGAKNYVDSYLTFQLLRRLEGERKKKGGAPASDVKGAPRK